MDKERGSDARVKLWGGRFSKPTDHQVDDFNSSIGVDQRMYKEDIAGSMAHARMLAQQRIISEDDCKRIVSGLQSIQTDIEEGRARFQIDAEDVHMNVETMLIERVGDAGKRLHTGRSRNDQVALDLRMYLKSEIQCVRALLRQTMQTLTYMAHKHTRSIMPGYTHMQKAQPVTFAHHVMAYVEMLRRDYDRLRDCRGRTDVMPLGSGALAATTHRLDRERVARELGFSAVSRNSLDAVADRDFVIELVSALSMLMMHLSRFCEELVLWSSHEFGFVEMDDAFATGSSIMPQKKNPDVAELIRGKTGRVYGHLMALLTTMKALPLAYNKDMQEDKEAVFDSVDTVKMCLRVFDAMVSSMRVCDDAMLRGAKGGFTNATDVADYCVKKGLPFREAHAVVGKMVAFAISSNKTLEELTMDEMHEFSRVIDEDIYSAIDMETCVNSRRIVGGPATETCEQAIRETLDFLTREQEDGVGHTDQE